MTKRVVIFGRSGSGKSVFAKELSLSLNLPVFHLDKYFYKSHWIERDDREFMEILRALVEKEAWIIDGNSLRSLEIRYARADLILYFTLPRRLCCWQIFKRRVLKNKGIDDRAPQCPERITWKLLKYTWTFEKRVSKQLIDYKEKYPHIPFFEVKTSQMKSQLAKQFRKVQKKGFADYGFEKK